MEKKTSSVEISIKLPKDIIEFLRALHSFSKTKSSFEEFLGDHIVQGVQADFSDNLENVIDMKQIMHGYGLDKIPELQGDC